MRVRSLGHLGNQDLRDRLRAAAKHECSGTAAVLCYIAEFDDRRLYLEDGFPSMFAYCVKELHYSEDAAYMRIRAARTARRHPQIFGALAEGRLHLAAVVLLAPHLTRENGTELLGAVVHKTKAEVLSLLAERFPQPDLVTRVRALPTPAVTIPELVPERVPEQSGALLVHMPELVPERATIREFAISESAICESSISEPPSVPERVHAPAPISPPRVTPLAPRRFGLQLTMSQEMHEKLQYAKSLLSHQIPSGDLTTVLERALDALIRERERKKFAASSRPRHVEAASKPPPPPPGSRCIPTHVRRAVWKRDQGRCTFVTETGYRCESRSFLEYDHVEPVARGGRATVDGIRLRCRPHNQYTAERTFGSGFMERKRATARERARPTVGGP